MKLTDTIKNVLENTMHAKEFFEFKSIAIDVKNPMSEQLTLKNFLLFNKISPENFLNEFEDYVLDKNQELSIGASEEDSALWARIPCVVQLPFENGLKQWLEEKELEHLEYNINLVEFGEKWINDLFEIAKPTVLLGAGIEGMINNKVLNEEYDFDCACAYNKDFVGMEDPKGIFRVISGIPLVLVVNEDLLQGRKIEGFTDLLKDEWKDSVCYTDDGHMLDGILFTYFIKEFGTEGLDKMKESFLLSAHPSQMIKPGGIEENPAVYIMPYIFAEIMTREVNMKLIWPKEGAAFLPLVITVKKDGPENERKIAQFICGEACGNALVTQGKFPSSCPTVENNLPGKLWWIGWDYLYQSDIISQISIARKIVEREG